MKEQVIFEIIGYVGSAFVLASFLMASVVRLRVINSVGCPKCRPVYREKLVGYLKGHYDELCDTCKSRLDRNPLRVLDCKEDHEIVAGGILAQQEW